MDKRSVPGGRAYPSRRLVLASGISVMAAGPIAGCATLHIPDFPVPPAAGLKQAADEHAEVNLYVVRDQGDQRTYFGTELAPKGVLPVWLSVRNKSAHESIALDFRDVRIDAQGRAIAEPERAHAPVNTAGEQGVVLVGAALLSLPLLFGGRRCCRIRRR